MVNKPEFTEYDLIELEKLVDNLGGPDLLVCCDESRCECICHTELKIDGLGLVKDKIHNLIQDYRKAVLENA